ncbi:ABC transporter ATP-binding protein [Stappia taiwanensis]|uniref:ABC transporter ATP-binding protein n=1 Tax=Stappia taiwanensis TaxID=992267 RepID=A0A838XMD4_9HYPH|nr:ABC transporter ATP-binding protein [Stappia taiwanensis]MBA4611282.1 ABC transporter ATP-binding protein [Stappia taiwanensis]GGE87372.1 ABC transporter ATP-binding protein [Stappia taiwanensis]
MSTSAPLHISGKAIELRGISRVWDGKPAVDELSISVPAGSFTVLLGPSGCGKSTTLRMIAGLEEADGGRIEIGGRDVTRLPSAERDLAMVFQSYALFPHLTVAENIIFGLKVRRTPQAERQDRLEKVAELLGLSALLHRKPAQLSGGQQQRVALGRAIIAERPVCLMDEPLSNLDAKLRHEMRLEIRALQRQLGFTMIYVTHDQVEAITMADQVVLLNGGKVEQAAPPRELYTRPATPFVARFIGGPPMNVIAGAALPAVEAASPGCLLGLRPEALVPDADGPLATTVTGVEYLGADLLIDCTLNGAPLVVRVHGQREIEVGQPLRLAFAIDDLHVFEGETGPRRDDLKETLGPLMRS